MVVGCFTAFVAAGCGDDFLVVEPRARTGVWAGVHFSCGQLDGGALHCWGDNDQHQLGVDAAELAPQPVRGLGEVTEAALGWDHACALDLAGAVWCWGANDLGQLGRGDAGGSTPNPEQVLGLDDVVEISAGRDYTCARERDNEILCWGRNDRGQLGRGAATPYEATPSAVLDLPAVRLVAAGRLGACALDMTGVAWCWGHTITGLYDQPVPFVVPGLSGPFQTMDSSFDHHCALDSDGMPWCWGEGSASHAMAEPRAIDEVRADVVGVAHQRAYGLRDGVVSWWWCRHLDWMGGPDVVPLSGAVTSLSVGDYHACAVIGEESLWCWGANHSGQLGDGTAEEHDEPVRVLLSAQPEP